MDEYTIFERILDYIEWLTTALTSIIEYAMRTLGLA